MKKLKPIKEFSGKYNFLSNFYMSPVSFQGIIYTNAEAAYQSAKTQDMSIRRLFKDYDPSKAKKEGRNLDLRSDWEQVKFDIMYEICYSKFSWNLDMSLKLLQTGHVLLEEGNHWGDKIWGTVNGEGMNHLGLTLMRIRQDMRSNLMEAFAIIKEEDDAR